MYIIIYIFIEKNFLNENEIKMNHDQKKIEIKEY